MSAVRSVTALRQLSAAASQPAAHQHVVGQHHRLQLPGHQVVAGPQPQVIQERVEHLAAVGLGGGAVVIDVFGVVLHHRFQGQPQPADGVLARQRPVQLGHQAERLLGIGFLQQRFQVGVDALVQDRPQVPQHHEPLGEEVVAVAFDELFQSAARVSSR